MQMMHQVWQVLQNQETPSGHCCRTLQGLQGPQMLLQGYLGSQRQRLGMLEPHSRHLGIQMHFQELSQSQMLVLRSRGLQSLHRMLVSMEII